ncbi:hypothetical protein AU467_32590 [Mesorhizobium loti]|uniref:Beta-lactamase-related domain-containing protein n=1 Tax=Rhizobium loti TaxID=381 RepID=A0A117N1Z5_RHILI|nr:hypothetical protein AU467_32590 [Mesorhizobium loti]
MQVCHAPGQGWEPTEAREFVLDVGVAALANDAFDCALSELIIDKSLDLVICRLPRKFALKVHEFFNSEVERPRRMTVPSVANPDLEVLFDNKARWNLPDFRRHGFHNLHTTMRYAMSLRAPRILPLRKEIDWTVGERPEVARYLAMPHFSAFIAVRDDRILYEAYAPDFGPDRPHPIMSITKTTINLMLGRCVSDGLIDLDRPVKDYLPEIGTGYAEATVKATADMNVANDYTEDYTDANSTVFDLEAALGWRLPREGQKEETTHSFLCGITGSDLTNRSGEVLYKSANSEVLRWIIERASGRPLRDWLIEIVEAAGIEGCFHIACDREGVPGSAFLTARDLARYGLLFARKGEGIGGRRVGDAASSNTRAVIQALPGRSRAIAQDIAAR